MAACYPGSKSSGWQWGKLHRVSFAHALALQKPLDQVFNRGPFRSVEIPILPVRQPSSPTIPTTTKPGRHRSARW